MGGSTSTPTAEDLLDVTNCDKFNKAPKSFQKYGQGVSDGLLGMMGCLDRICTKFDKKFYTIMTDDEKQEFAQLEVRKTKSVDEIYRFVGEEKNRFARMRNAAAPGKSLRQLLRDVPIKGHCDIFQKMIDNLNKLSEDYKAFNAELEKAIRKDGRNTKENIRILTQYLLFGVAVIGAIIGFTLLAIHFLPSGLVLTYTGCAWVGGSLTTAVIAGSISATLMSKSELSRTITYLDDLTGNLQELKCSLLDIDIEKDTLLEDCATGTNSVDHFKNICLAMEQRCVQSQEMCKLLLKT